MDHLPDNLSTILKKLGRSSTPPVPNTPFGVTLDQLIGTNIDQVGTNLIIGTPTLENYLKNQNIAFTMATPGTAIAQASDERVISLIIEADAFHNGLWLGADNGTSGSLVDEIFESGRHIRARGGIVFLIPSKTHRRGPAYLKIESTTNTNLTEIPEVDLEENAPQSLFWNSILSYINSPLRKGNRER